VITFIVALGVGGKHLSIPPPEVPATPVAVLSFASTIAGFVLSWSPLSSDFTTYFHPDVSRWLLSDANNPISFLNPASVSFQLENFSLLILRFPAPKRVCFL
jgi:hypothetical protein